MGPLIIFLIVLATIVGLLAYWLPPPRAIGASGRAEEFSVAPFYRGSLDQETSEPVTDVVSRIRAEGF